MNISLNYEQLEQYYQNVTDAIEAIDSSGIKLPLDKNSLQSTENFQESIETMKEYTDNLKNCYSQTMVQFNNAIDYLKEADAQMSN